jgi:serine/threonine protein kinase/S1-C subfamily serine protease
MPAADPHSVIGETLTDRYLVTDKLGEGGMGSVYKADDLKLGAEVVIKIPHPALMKDADFASRFRHEIRSLVKLSHAHIVTVMDVGTYNGLPFAVMQYLSGGSLEDWECPCEPASILEWLGDIADALDFMHARGLVHRDIKPANIFIDESGRACLGDFGIAKVLAAGEDSGEKGLTGTGMAIGTAEYMAPEMLMPDLYSEEYDGRADQYALAVAVYEMLADRPPFQGDTMATVAVKLAQTNPPPLYELQPSISAGLWQAVERALAKNPGNRYPNCRAFAEAVSAAIRSEPAARHTSVAARLPTQAQQRSTSAAARPQMPTVKETASGAPQRTVQERRGAALPRTLEESRPDHRQTMPEVRPVGIDEMFIAVDGDSKPQRARFVEWVKSPVGMSSVAGGIVLLLVTGVVLSQMGQSDGKTEADSAKVVSASDTEDIRRETTGTEKSRQRKQPAADNGDSPQKSRQTPSAAVSPSDLAGLVKSLEPAIVRINVDLAVGGRSGSGFVVDASGLIVTNHHIVKGARKARATFADGTTKEIEGFRLLSPDKDIAILQLAKPFGRLEVAPLTNVFPKQGEFAATLGLPKGRAVTPSEGIVEAILAESELAELGLAKDGTWIQTTAQISPETSGGPLISRNGLVIGVNTWLDTAKQNRNFVISAVDIRDAIAAAKFSQLVTLSSSRPPTSTPQPNRFVGTFRTTPQAFGSIQAKEFEERWFGAVGVDLSTRTKRDRLSLKRAGLKTETGFFLTIVAYGSPAYDAGLRKNDVIKTVNGDFISTFVDLSKVVNATQRGQTLQIEALKLSAKGRYQTKAARISVTVQGVIPQYAINSVLQLKCPDPVKEYLLLQLLDYSKRLSSVSQLATRGGELNRQRVDVIRKAGPFDLELGPSLSGNLSIKVGTIGRADSARIMEIVGDDFVRIQLAPKYRSSFQVPQRFKLPQASGTTMLLAGDTAGLVVGARDLPPIVVPPSVRESGFR